MMRRSTLILVFFGLVAQPVAAQFTVPNNDVAFNLNQSRIFSTDIAALVQGLNGDGVLSGCAVTAQGSPNMTVAVASGSVVLAGVIVSVSSGNLTVTTAHPTSPRLDIVVVNGSGTKAIVAGTAAANPSPPAIPASSVLLATLYIPRADTTIATNQITDKRVLVLAAVSSSRRGLVPIGTGSTATFLNANGAYSTPAGTGVTSIATTSPITGGTITTTGTIACATCATTSVTMTANRLVAGNGTTDLKVTDLTGDVTTSGAVATTLANSGASAGTYGSTTQAPVITVDAKGRITAVSNATVSPGGGSGGGLVLLEQHTASSSATLDFTTCFSSTYDDYQLRFVGLVPASNHVNLHVLVSTDGGGTWANTTYEWLVRLASNGDTSVSVATASTTSEWKLSLPAGPYITNTAGGSTTGAITLSNLLSASLWKQFSGSLAQTIDVSGTVRIASADVTGEWRTTTAVNAVRVQYGSGNIASGTIRCYGIAKT